MLDYKCYDIHDAKITPDVRMKKLFQIKVPGIAEKRPNVLRGDKIYIQEEQMDNDFELDKLYVG